MHRFQRSITDKRDKKKALMSIHLKDNGKSYSRSGRLALLDNLKSVLSSASEFLVKAFSWIAVFESSEKFQPTTSMKSLESVLEQLQAL